VPEPLSDTIYRIEVHHDDALHFERWNREGAMQRLVRRFIDPRHARFSASFIGISSGVLMIPMGLSLFAAAPTIGSVPPTWMWLISLIGIPFAGMLLHFNTRRLVYIKSFFTAVMLLWSLVYGSAAWYVLSWGMGCSFQVVVGLGIVAVLFVVGQQTYLVTIRSPERERMPHEIIGVLDQTTGIVDPSSGSPSAQARVKQMDRSTALMLRLAPLTGGLSLLTIRSLPATSDLVLLLIVALVFATVGAIGTGSNVSYVVASRRWEQKHGKPMCIKKT